MVEKAIVTLSDSKYFPLLMELINSFEDNNKDKEVKMCVLDAGLSKDQKEIVSKKVFKIEKAK